MSFMKVQQSQKRSERKWMKKPCGVNFPILHPLVVWYVHSLAGSLLLLCPLILVCCSNVPADDSVLEFFSEKYQKVGKGNPHSLHNICLVSQRFYVGKVLGALSATLTVSPQVARPTWRGFVLAVWFTRRCNIQQWPSVQPRHPPRRSRRRRVHCARFMIGHISILDCVFSLHLLCRSSYKWTFLQICIFLNKLTHKQINTIECVDISVHPHTVKSIAIWLMCITWNGIICVGCCICCILWILGNNNGRCR